MQSHRRFGDSAQRGRNNAVRVLGFVNAATSFGLDR
jgi:hypothetical protein